MSGRLRSDYICFIPCTAHTRVVLKFGDTKLQYGKNIVKNTNKLVMFVTISLPYCNFVQHNGDVST